MNQDRHTALPTLPVHGPSAGFYAANAAIPVNLVGPPVFTSQLYSHPANMRCAFYPPGSTTFMPQLSNAGWSTGVRVIRPPAVVGIQPYMQPVEC